VLVESGAVFSSSGIEDCQSGTILAPAILRIQYGAVFGSSGIEESVWCSPVLKEFGAVFSSSGKNLILEPRLMEHCFEN
jgi:hypothetical protein